MPGIRPICQPPANKEDLNDDEHEVRNVIRLELGGTRYELLEAEDGEQGIEPE